MNTEELLKSLEKEVAVCQRCRLYKTANCGVPGTGSPRAEIMFVGEAPGYHEDQQGKPFVGRAGQLLDKLLAEIDLKREDVYITNVVKHRPPENRDPFPDEIKACKPYLDRQLELINPRVIVTLGRFGLQYFVPEGKISTDRGIPRKFGTRIIFPVYHPAAALRNGAMLEALRQDFQKLPKVLSEEMSVKSITQESENNKNQMRLI